MRPELRKKLEEIADMEHRDLSKQTIHFLEKEVACYFRQHDAKAHVEEEIKTARKRPAAKRSRDAG